MEPLAAALARLEAWWEAGAPLPPPPDPALVTVLGTVVGALGLAALAAGWADRRLSLFGLFAAVAGGALLGWLLRAVPGFGWHEVPLGFVELVARIVR